MTTLPLHTYDRFCIVSARRYLNELEILLEAGQKLTPQEADKLRMLEISIYDLTISTLRRVKQSKEVPHGA